MQALLVALEPLTDSYFLNYKPSAGRGEPNTWVTRQTGKIRQTGKKNIDQGHSNWVVVAGYI
jgi:hypothetical protein